MKICAKLKISLTCDNNGNLYSWGSKSSGLLGYKSEFDVNVPSKVEIRHENTLYKVEKISIGHFHAGIIATRKDVSSINNMYIDPEKEKLFEPMFKKLKEWFDTIFLTNIKSNFKSFLKIMLKVSGDTKYLNYDSIDYNFLEAFYSHQHIRKKDMYKIEQFYSKLIKSELKMSESKKEVDLQDLEKLLSYSNNYYLKEIKNYYEYIVQRFNSHPDDFSFFVKLICKFKPYLMIKDIYNLFDYSNYDPNLEIHSKDKDLLIRISTLFNELKISYNVIKDVVNNQIVEKYLLHDNKNVITNTDEYFVETNYLIDCILKLDKGFKYLLTWGANTEGRLGIILDEENSSFYIKEDKTQGENNRLVYYPTLVHFPSVYTKVKLVSCGYSHTLALVFEGDVYSWGSGKYGCLGLKNNSVSYTPKKIELDIDGNLFNNISDISCGMYFSIALNTNGIAYSWGCGNNGRLGHGDENSVGNPKIISYFEKEEIKLVKVCCGDIHSAAITISKELYTWGCGNYGMLGHGNFTFQTIPTFVEFFKDIKVDDVFLGSSNCMVISSDNRTYGWGKNPHGMLGIPSLVNQNILIPQQVFIKDEGTRVISISIGKMHTLILMSDGSIFSMGNSLEGILGIHDTYDKIIEPTKIQDLKFYVSKSLDIREKTLYKYLNSNGTIKVDASKNPLAIVQISVNNTNTAFISNNGDLYMCGEDKLILKSNSINVISNFDYNSKKDKIITLKDSTNENCCIYDKNKFAYKAKDNQTWTETIIKLNFPEISEKVTFISLGKTHVICIARGKAYSWGSNEYGKLGLSNRAINEYISYPSLIYKVGENVKMSSVSDSHSLVLTHNGEVYSFGQNMYGKLGLGNINKYFNYETEKLSEPYEQEPQMVKNIIYAEYIACSNTHSACIMKLDYNYENSYQVFTWGSGFSGKLGNNDFGDCYEPKLVEDNDIKYCYIVQIALGEEFTLALDINHNLWGWGRKKFLGYYNDYDFKNDYIKTPKILNKDIKFKYISANDIGCLALDISGNIYGFGKITINEKSRFYKLEYNSPLFRSEAMDFICCSKNHFGSISQDYKLPYTWGSNIFFKCGQKFAKGAISKLNQESNFFSDNPKKISYFSDIINSKIENKTHIISSDNNNINKKNLSENLDTYSVIKKNRIQSFLLEEKLDYKNENLIKEDLKLNKSFYLALQEYFKTLNTIEQLRKNTKLNADNKILSILNKTRCIKKNSYISDIPKIINMNYQIYEIFITLLHIHPCYLSLALFEMKNKKTFISLIRSVLGKGHVVMNSKRVNNILIGLWNSVFSKEKHILKAEIERLDDIISYDIYFLIYTNSKENLELIYDIVADLLLVYINEISENPNTKLIELSEDCDVLTIYKDIEDNKQDINNKVILLLRKRLCLMFSDLNKNNSNKFSTSVLWILKQITSVFYTNKDIENNDFYNNLSSIDQEKHSLCLYYKIINCFLFDPFVKILKSIKESSLDNISTYSEIIRFMTTCLERNKDNPDYNKLYNLYSIDKKKCQNNIFKKVAFPKTDILNQIIEIFSALSRSDIQHDTIDDKLFLDANTVKKEILIINRTIKNGLIQYDYDFTYYALKDLIKNNSENCNEVVTVPICIKDLIDIQNYLLELLSCNELYKRDPLRTVLMQLSNFKISELDTTSSIRNFVINFNIKPSCFIYQGSNSNLFKCEYCLLPLSDIFFMEEEIESCLDGKKWTCSTLSCSTENNSFDVKCKLCKTYVKLATIYKNTFFKKFEIPNNQEPILCMEEVLYNLPQLNDSDDVEKEVIIQIDNIKDKKDNVSQKNLLKSYERFISILKNCLTSNEEATKYESEKYELIQRWYLLVEENIKSRDYHSKYIKSIYDFISFINQASENAKNYYDANKGIINRYIFNAELGFSNEFARDNSPLVKISSVKSNQLEIINKPYKGSNLLKKYLVSDLIKKKVIDEILFSETKDPKLEQKSVLFFEKVNNGYELNLIFKDIYRKYIVCGINKNEYLIESNFISNDAIYELRRIAKTNSTFNVGGIRFNIFYLVSLLNSLENN